MTNGNGIVLDDFDGCQPSVCFLVTTLPKVPLPRMRRIKNAIYDVDYVDFGSDAGHCFNVFVDDNFEGCQLAVCYQVTAWPQVPPPQTMRIKNHGDRPT